MLIRVCLRAKVEIDTFLFSKNVNEMAERFEALAALISWVGVFWVVSLLTRGVAAERVTFRPPVYEVLGSHMSEDLSRHVSRFVSTSINKCTYKIQSVTSIKLLHVSALG